MSDRDPHVHVTALDLPRQPEVVAQVLPTSSEWGQVLQSNMRARQAIVRRGWLWTVM